MPINGRVKVVKLVMPLNALLPIVSTLAGITNRLSVLMLLNAYSPMSLTEFGIEIVVSDVFENA